MEIDVQRKSVAEVYQCLTSLVAPRPIALVSSINKEGAANLSPFSFFNLFSSNPPIVIFSSLRRRRDHTIKPTLHNIMEVPEVVVNIVTIDIIGQTLLASCEYGRGVDEFAKAGFSKERARMVKPPMVREAKAKLEGEVIEIKPLGPHGDSGNLVICKIVYLHVDDTVCQEDGRVDPSKLELAARLGGDLYGRVNAEATFSLPQPSRHRGVGMDGLPPRIRASRILTGNELAQLANIEQLPVCDEYYRDERIEGICTYLSGERRVEALHRYASELIEQGKIEAAWQVLLTEVRVQEDHWLEGNAVCRYKVGKEEQQFPCENRAESC